MPERTLRISQVGLRGIVGSGLSASRVLDFASAFASFLPVGKPVLLGRDPRASGVMIREGVIAALLACGHDVVDLGLVSTPVIQHAILRWDAAGGISIGASHNAAEWNALKFFGPRGTYLSTSEANELLDIYHLRLFNFQDWTGVGTLRQDERAIDQYVDNLAAHYDMTALQGMRVVVDCCNGTSAPVLRCLRDRYGLDFVLINEALRGTLFAHEPAIAPGTVALQLAPLVKPLQAEAGFLFDVDSDRVALATNEGVPVSEEATLPLLADYLLPKGSGKLIITNLSTTSLVDWIAAKHGGSVLRVPVGRQATTDALAVHRADEIALAGEGSGAVMLPQFRFVYDGIASMLGILSLIRERGQTISQILDSYPRYSILKGQVPLVAQNIPDLLRKLQQQFPEGQRDLSDGLRIDFGESWFHVRVSQTEPIVRVICEACGDPPRELYRAVMDIVRGAAEWRNASIS